MQRTGQVLSDITHGGHIPEEAAPKVLVRDGAQPMLLAAADEVTFETPFDYLFPNLATDPASHLPMDNPATVVASLKALGDAMVEETAPAGGELQATDNSTIPPVYTYWGQFIDHDLTANTDRDSAVSDITKPDMVPLDPTFVVANLKNLRQPTLNLDSVYGDGPAFPGLPPTRAGSFYDGIKFKVGTNATASIDPTRPVIAGVHIPSLDPSTDDLNRDLPRIDKKAQIADARNDENLIIAQFHTAFLRFHNNVVDQLEADGHHHRRGHIWMFQRAQRLTRWHYQWLVVNDFLKTVTKAGVVDKVLLGGPKFYKPTGEPFMPLEFSVAAYRFGHTMVRAAYDYNRNFGRAEPGQSPVIPNAPFNLLFNFTGNGFPQPFIGQTNELPFNWIIEWERFVDKGSSVPDHFARKIDILLAPPLKDMVNQGNDAATPDIKDILKRLARRNLLRGYLLSLPTGQAVAQAMGVTPLSADELRQGNSGALNQLLNDGGFYEHTPLRYYVLKEAQVQANGNSLGELGSRIVCETIIGQLRCDPTSYLNHRSSWDPSEGVNMPNGDPIVTIHDFIQFAGIPA